MVLYVHLQLKIPAFSWHSQVLSTRSKPNRRVAQKKKKKDYTAATEAMAKASSPLTTTTTTTNRKHRENRNKTAICIYACWHSSNQKSKWLGHTYALAAAAAAAPGCTVQNIWPWNWCKSFSKCM